MNIFLRFKLAWAELTGSYVLALTLRKEITMADFIALSSAVDRVATKVAADVDALTTAQAAVAAEQPQIDALTAKLDAIAPATV